MKNKEKKCKTCGRIITNPSNKLGVCSNCKGKGLVGATTLAVGAFFVKKNGPRLLQILKKIGPKMLNITKKTINFFKR